MSTNRRLNTNAGRAAIAAVAIAAVVAACVSAIGCRGEIAKASSEAVRAGGPMPSGTGAAAVELQPLSAQVRRLIEALDYIGAPLASDDRRAIESASADADGARGAAAIAGVLDRYVLVDVEINPESRVHVTQGRARPEIVQSGWRTFLVKVRNAAGVTA